MASWFPFPSKNNLYFEPLKLVVACDGFSGSDPATLKCLDTWPTVGATVWKRLGRVALLDVSQGVGRDFEVSTACATPS